MKPKTLFTIPLMAVLVFATAGTSTYAALTVDQIVTHFNDMNGKTGFNFTYSSSRYTTKDMTQQVDISAYAPNQSGVSQGLNYFNSFCADPYVGSVASSGYAKLSYDPLTGQTKNSSGVYLSVGAAYLYQQYALGQYTASQSTLLSQLNRRETASLNWTTNSYLLSLLNIVNDQEFWLGKYDARQDYAFMGDNVVFVMNLTNTSGGTTQNFYYLANKSTYDIGFGPGDPGVPEPASLLLWTLGGLGLVCSSRARKRRLKRLARAV